nr:hypothetical protein [Tanacetum cinerariifolium]
KLGWNNKPVLDSERNPTTTNEPERQRFVTLVKQSQELKHVSYHKLYDILKQHQHEVNESRAEKIARNSSIKMHQSATRKREKAIVNSPQPMYDQEPSMVDDDEDSSKDKEIDKLMALISLSFKKIYKPTNNNHNCKEYRHVARECQKPKRAKDAVYHREKMLLCKQEEAGIHLNAEQADWKDDSDNESDDQELEAHYMYMAKLQQVSPDVDDSGSFFDKEPKQKVQNDDHYEVFAIDCQHSKQSESVHNTYLIEQDAQNVLIESVDMNYDSEQIDQNDEDVDLAKERELLASFIAKLKCEIDERKNRNTL